MRPRSHLAAGLAGWLIAGGGLSGAAVQAADGAPTACPASFTPPRPQFAAEPGWQAVWSGDPVEQLAGIEVTHGPREALEYLVPEDRYEGSQIIQTWDLRPMLRIRSPFGSIVNTRILRYYLPGLCRDRSGPAR